MTMLNGIFGRRLRTVRDPDTSITNKREAEIPAHDKRVNLLLLVTSLNFGGLEVVVQRLVQTIDRERFNVTVCCTKRLGQIGDQLARDGIYIHALSNSADRSVDYFAFLKLLKLIRRRRIDIVHTHTIDAMFDAAMCKLLVPRLRFIHTFHFGNYPHRTKRRMWMERVFSRIPNRLCAVGEVQRQQIISAFRLRNQRIGRVWNGVSEVSQCAGESFRALVGAEDRILIGTICTLTEQKGLPDLLTVATEFRDDSNHVRFVVVGDGPLRPQLEAMRRELGLDDVVVFTGWVRNAADEALPAFDVFFQPSLWEAMSIVILEAMAAAKPIVATRVGETPHIIESDVDGLLVNPKDTRGMVAALRRLLADSQLRSRIGSAAKTKVKQQFTVENMTRSYEEIYLEMLQQ